MPATTKTTVYLDLADYQRLKVLAGQGGRTPAELIREAIREYVQRRGAGRKPRSLGAGRSGRNDLSERAEELLKGMAGRR